jgi:hypothetical protein
VPSATAAEAGGLAGGGGMGGADLEFIIGTSLLPLLRRAAVLLPLIFFSILSIATVPIGISTGGTVTCNIASPLGAYLRYHVVSLMRIFFPLKEIHVTHKTYVVT